MQALRKLSSYVCNKSFSTSHVPYRDEFIDRWGVQLRKNRGALSTFVKKDSASSTTTKSSFIRTSADFGNVSPFSSTSRGNKHIFRAYPSSHKIDELCFETTAAYSTIICRAQLSFLPLREAGTGFVGVLPLPSTHF